MNDAIGDNWSHIDKVVKSPYCRLLSGIAPLYVQGSGCSRYQTVSGTASRGGNERGNALGALPVTWSWWGAAATAFVQSTAKDWMRCLKTRQSSGFAVIVT